MTLIWKLGLWAGIIWLLPVLYFLTKNEFKPKKNIITGVTLPYEAQNDPAVEALLDRCGREMKQICWTGLAAAAPSFLLQGFGAFMTYLLTWTTAACIVLFIPYVRCNKALQALKAERGWKRAADASRMVTDLTAAAGEMRWASPWWFAPPFAAGLAPLFFERELWPLWAVDAALVPLFYFCYRCLYRNRAEVVDADSRRTMALTRIRRYNWGKFWVVMAWAAGAFSIGIWLTRDRPWLCMGVALLYGVAVCAEVVGIELRVRRLQEKLTADCGPEAVDEDDRWIWGIFYYNPNDARMMVNARVGINATFNLAKRPAQIFMLFLAALLLACPLLGVWMMGMERAPVELAVTEAEITGAHFGGEWSVALEDIETVEVVEELPRLRRVAGTGLSNALTGNFNGDGWGKVTVCIDPRVGPWLLVERKDGERFLFGGSEEGAASAAAERLR